jgi:hypothetical protein
LEQAAKIQGVLDELGTRLQKLTVEGDTLETKFEVARLNAVQPTEKKSASSY